MCLYLHVFTLSIFILFIIFVSLLRLGCWCYQARTTTPKESGTHLGTDRRKPSPMTPCRPKQICPLSDKIVPLLCSLLILVALQRARALTPDSSPSAEARHRESTLLPSPTHVRREQQAPLLRRVSALNADFPLLPQQPLSVPRRAWPSTACGPLYSQCSPPGPG